MIYGLHLCQKGLVEKICFDRCGKILIGCIDDEDIGPFFPCKEESCQWEEKRSEVFGEVGGELFCIRKLKAEEEG